MIYYTLHEQDIHSSNNAHHKSYGINAFRDGLLICTVKDISNSKSDIQNLVDKINDYELDICHLSQVVEDYLYDLCID